MTVQTSVSLRIVSVRSVSNSDQSPATILPADGFLQEETEAAEFEAFDFRPTAFDLRFSTFDLSVLPLHSWFPDCIVLA